MQNSGAMIDSLIVPLRRTSADDGATCSCAVCDVGCEHAIRVLPDIDQGKGKKGKVTPGPGQGKQATDARSSEELLAPARPPGRGPGIQLEEGLLRPFYFVGY